MSMGGKGSGRGDSDPKNEQTKRELQEMFRQRKVEKGWAAKAARARRNLISRREKGK